MALGGNCGNRGQRRKSIRMLMLQILLLLLQIPQAELWTHVMSCPIRDPVQTPQQYYRRGDFTIGASISQSILMVNEYSLKGYPASDSGPPIIVTKNYQHILAVVFAINEINENPNILPNVSLGFHIVDSYFSTKRTYYNAMELLCRFHTLVPNYKCEINNLLIAVIGGLGAEASRHLATLLDIYKLPQFSYGDFDLMLNSQTTSPTLYRMVPNEAHQYNGIVQLLLHFRWTWIGIVTMDDDEGDIFLKNMLPILLRRGICSAFIERMSTFNFITEFFSMQISWQETYDAIMGNKATVVVVHGETKAMICLRGLLYQGEASDKSFYGKVWIMVAQLDLSAVSLHKDWPIQSFHGALAFTIHSQQVPGFQKFIQNLRPHVAEGDGFIRTFWEQAFGCSFPDEEAVEGTCTGEERLESLPGPFFEMGMTGHSYSIYNAAHAIAHSLHAMHSSKSWAKLGRRLQPQTIQPWQVPEFKSMTQPHGSTGSCAPNLRITLRYNYLTST